MLFKEYTIYENKLSEHIRDDNPLKQKLVKMETSTDEHPVYSFLIWTLLIYSWIFWIILCYNQAYNYILSFINLIFISISIFLNYKKSYLIGNIPQFRRNLYIIGFFSLVLSFLITSKDYGTASWKEIWDSFLFLNNVTHKSYMAFSIVLYTALGVSLSYYTCPYELYRSFYSAHKTYPSEKNEYMLINKSLGLATLGLLLIWKVVYDAFNPAKDDFDSTLKSFSLFVIAFLVPIVVSTFQTKKYTYIFKKALKKQRNI